MTHFTRNLILLCIVLARLSAMGQNENARGVASTETQNVEKARKLIFRVDPVYPPDLKRFSIGGTVRLDVKISPQGTVRAVSPVGGNPALVEAAATAVKKWKYSPADTKTNVRVNVSFDPHR